ncbi:MAG: hypothetical protein GEU79_01315 [Acidimicrobiia bacterium]|nr:hypothetical protein [Acidimicrobiia bacterium]
MTATSPLPPFSFNGALAAEVFILGYGYWFAMRRLAPHRPSPTMRSARRGQVIRFVSGLVIMWTVASWPFHDIAEESLFSVHMIEHLVLGYAVPSLLLSGIPRWLAEWLVPRRIMFLF